MPRSPKTIYEPVWVKEPITPGPRLVNPPPVDVTVDAGVMGISVRIQGILSHFPPAAPNQALDNVFDCRQLIGGVPRGIPVIGISISGTWFNLGIVADPINIKLAVVGKLVLGKVLSFNPVIGIGVKFVNADIITEAGRQNWVKWTNIGELDFTIGRDNLAGERPLDWKGWIYGLKKLGSHIVAYGENGVSYLVPSDNTYGLQTLHRIGLIGRQSYCGTDVEHYFIDREGRLYRLGDKVELLDYREYLSQLGPTTVMSYDPSTGLIYICDGLKGFVYSTNSNSLGEGPVNITGAGYQNGQSYITASAVVDQIPVELCTDIYDFESRRNKTITSFEIGTNVQADLWAAIDYRLYIHESFSTTPWYKVNPNGITPISCFGVEFRLRLKQLTPSPIELDYIRINGFVHNYVALDSYDRGRRI